MKNCKHCNVEITVTKTFCSHRCAALYHNNKPGQRDRASKKAKARSSAPPTPPKRTFTRVRQCVVCQRFFPVDYDSSKKTCCSLECSRSRMSEGGRKSAAIQTSRSADEILLYDLCAARFGNVTHNTQLVDGWDADVVLWNQRVAILWNGPWHYRDARPSTFSPSGEKPRSHQG